MDRGAVMSALETGLGRAASDIENYKQITHFCKKLLMSLKSQLIKDV